MTSTGIRECSARGWFSVGIVHESFRFLTLSFVRIFSSLAQPVRWLSPPSVTQSINVLCGAPPLRCAATVNAAQHHAPATR